MAWSLMSDSDIDAAILECSEPYWMKVAMIITRASKKLTGTLDDELMERIGGRIQILAATNQLASQGDLTKWRYSEVRLPPA